MIFIPGSRRTRVLQAAMEQLPRPPLPEVLQPPEGVARDVNFGLTYWSWALPDRPGCYGHLVIEGELHEIPVIWKPWITAEGGVYQVAGIRGLRCSCILQVGAREWHSCAISPGEQHPGRGVPVYEIFPHEVEVGRLEVGVQAQWTTSLKPPEAEVFGLRVKGFVV